MHRVAPLPGDPLLLSLFTALPALPQPPQLQYTVALTVGAYADWLADTAIKGGAEGQALVGQLLQMLMKGEPGWGEVCMGGGGGWVVGWECGRLSWGSLVGAELGG